MPVDYKVRNLRRLFGLQNFLQPAPRQTQSLRSAQPAAAPDSQHSAKPDQQPAKSKKSAAPGGLPRAFFSEQPPRAIRSKAVSGQLYSVHLIEKQKMKVYYGAMSDKKFKKYVEEAKAKRYNTDAQLLRLLELRLDTFLYRTGFVQTPSQARQWICHNQICVNGRPINIKSLRLQPGDIVTIRDRHVAHALNASKQVASMRQKLGCGASWILSSADPAGMLPWMEIDRTGLAAALVRQPTDDEARSMARATLFPFIRDANMNPHAAMRAYR